MTYHAQINLIMFVTVAGLIMFLYFRPQLQDHQEYQVSSLTAEEVQIIRIVRYDVEMRLKKMNHHWHLIEPLQARADEKKVRKILDILSTTSIHRLPLSDLDRFGLDKPSAQLFIENESFSFGGLTPITNEQYLATDEYIFLISPRYAVTLPLQPSDLIDSRLLKTEEIPAKKQILSDS